MFLDSTHSRIHFSVILLVFTLFLVGCTDDDKNEASGQQDAVPMKVIKAATKDMPYWGEFVGQINAVETVDVRARVAGFLLKKKFEEGRSVKKGDLLFVIDPKPFQEDLKQSQSRLEYNEALLTKAEKDFERFKKLYGEGVVSRDEFESYQTEMMTLKAKVRDNQAQVENARIQLGYTNIYSPIDGTVGRVQVDVGNLVGQGENTLLATISTVDPVYVNFSISERDYIRVKRDRALKDGDKLGEGETKMLELVLADGSRYDYDGKFDMVDRAVDPRTGTLGIRLSFPNPDRLLRPGQYAKVRVLVENVRDAVVIPTRGLVDVQGTKSVYVAGDDGVVKSQPVTAGFEVKDLIVIKEGLKVGDMVIVDGIRRVKPKMTIKPIVVPMEKDAGQPASMGQQNGDQPKTDDNKTDEQAG